jgi:hypothetical protein
MPATQEKGPSHTHALTEPRFQLALFRLGLVTAMSLEKPCIREYSRQTRIPDRSWGSGGSDVGPQAGKRNLSIDPSRVSKR